MRRRRNTSPATAIVETVARLPWWAGVALALLFYVVLSRFASQPMPTTTDATQVGAFAVQAMGRALTTAGQYLLPLLCLLAAAVSAWRRHERRQLLNDATGSNSARAINEMSWRQFERLIAEGFSRQGYQVMEAGGGGADGGIDLVLRRGSERHLVQCKQWRAFKVGVTVVRELYGVMAAEGAAGGFVVTSGRFTGEARLFASGRNIELIDGVVLQKMLNDVQRPSRSRTRG